MHVLPLIVYTGALVAYIWHFAQRNPTVGRAATTLLVAAALAHTFVIGMLTMQAGQVPVSDATSAMSMFVWLLALA
jgi:ABC-type transport system involved in cytochrome c biogenesis permease subunit